MMIPRKMWILLSLAGFFCCSSCQGIASTFENKTGEDEGKPRVFSPRMDYDEWTPLGRGDPLKNNPTFDYVPPVLDRVHYWLDSHTTEASAKRDILVLGVTAKKTSPKIPEQFLKFVDGPKFVRSNQQDASHRSDFTGSTGAEPPKILRANSFRGDYRTNQNRIQSSYYPSPYYGPKSKPYTMMLPPPLNQKDKIVHGFAEPTRHFNTQTEEGPLTRDTQFYTPVPQNYVQQLPSKVPATKFAGSKGVPQTVSQIETIKSVHAASPAIRPKPDGVTAPTVSFEKSNLIYQSTQTLANGWPGGVFSSTTSSIPGKPAARFPQDYARDQYEVHAAASSNHEVVVKQSANVIVEGDNAEELVVGQKVAPTGSSTTDPTEISTAAPSASSLGFFLEQEKVDTEGETSGEKMHIVVANSPDNTAGKKGPVAVVMPANYSEKRIQDPATTQLPARQETTTPGPEEGTTVFSDARGEEASSGQDSTRPSGTAFSEVPAGNGDSSSRVLPQHAARPQSTMGSFPPRRPEVMLAPGHPQAPLSSMMHPQGMMHSQGMMHVKHPPMHFLGSVRPNLGFRMPASGPVFPPMTHMHAPPPPRSPMHHAGSSATLPGYRNPQQDFPSASASHSTDAVKSPVDLSVDGHRSPEPASIFTTPTVPPFLPTASSGEKDPESAVPTTGSGADKEEDRAEASAPTTVASMTTDPIFSHYKQPAQPLRGPMYLIIQGHSKVKTYKPTVSKHDVEGNEITEVRGSQVSKFEQFVQENAGNVDRANAAATERKRAEERAREEKLANLRQGDLLSLVENGFEDFTVAPGRFEDRASSGGN